MTSEDGEAFIKNLAAFVRSHEKSLANALQLQKRDTRDGKPLASPSSLDATHASLLSLAQSSGVSSLATVLSFGALQMSSTIKPAKLTLTPHHLFYLLSRFEDIGIDVGPMNVRLENIHAGTTPSNYVSFLSSPLSRYYTRGRDSDSIHSVSSMRSVMSNMSNFWTVIGTGGPAKTEKAKDALEGDTKYLYSAFTKIPCLRLSQDRRARMIKGYEEFPFDTAVPLLAFKNVSALEAYDVDFRQLYGWDRMSEQLRSLTIKRGNIEDPKDILVSVVMDDVERRRRRSSKPHSPSAPTWSSTTSIGQQPAALYGSSPGSPSAGNLDMSHVPFGATDHVETIAAKSLPRRADHSTSPRPEDRRSSMSHRRPRTAYEMQRSGSGGSDTSVRSSRHSQRNRSSSNLQREGTPPAAKWRFLRHLSLADNGITGFANDSFDAVGKSLVSLDLSSNLFVDVPRGLSVLGELKALNLSSCMIESIASFRDSPLPVVESLNLRGNRIRSLLGLEELKALARIDLRENRLSDPTEIGRLTDNPGIREIFVAGNPFTRSYTNYRIIIFNIFRSAAGYSEDILIDGTGPSYSERRHLKERVPLSVTQKSNPQDHHGLVPETVVQRHPSSCSQVPYTSKVFKSDVQAATVDSGLDKAMRKKQTQKKRMVDLSTTQHAVPKKVEVVLAERSSDPRRSFPSLRYESEAISAGETRTSFVRPPVHQQQQQQQQQDPSSALVRKTKESADFDGHAYSPTKKQAPRQEFGASWIHIPSEDRVLPSSENHMIHFLGASRPDLVRDVVPRQQLPVSAAGLGR